MKLFSTLSLLMPQSPTQSPSALIAKTTLRALRFKAIFAHNEVREKYRSKAVFTLFLLSKLIIEPKSQKLNISESVIEALIISPRLIIGRISLKTSEIKPIIIKNKEDDNLIQLVLPIKTF